MYTLKREATILLKFLWSPKKTTWHHNTQISISIQSWLTKTATMTYCAIGPWMTRLRTTSIVNMAWVDLTLLPQTWENVDISWWIVQTFHHLYHVGSCVFLSSVHPTQLQVCPVHVVTINSNCKWVDGCSYEDLNTDEIWVNKVPQFQQNQLFS